MKSQKTETKKHHSWFSRHRILSGIGIAILAAILILICWRAFNNYQAVQYQKSLDPFYTPPSPLPAGKPGDIIRSEPMNNASVPGGTAYRILYLTQLPDGSAAVSSGMIFVPTAPAPAGGQRKVVAW